jgi:hypothetical protein
MQMQSDQRSNDMAYWRSLIEEHFVEDGSLQLTLTTPQSRNGKVVPAKAFEISAPSLPRYFWMQYYDGEVEQIQIILNGNSEKAINDNYHYARAERARMLYWFKDGTQVSSCKSSFILLRLTLSQGCMDWLSHSLIQRFKDGDSEVRHT